MICKMFVRHKKHERRDTCVRVISYFLCCFTRQIFRVWNHLVVEAVIMHETKGFSRAIRDKIIVRENNRIAKCVQLIFTLSRTRPFFLTSFSHLACFSYLADVSRIICSQLQNQYINTFSKAMTKHFSQHHPTVWIFLTAAMRVLKSTKSFTRCS